MSIPLLGTRSVTQDLYAQALASSYLTYRVFDPDYASSKDADLYEKVRRDPIIAKAIDTRLHGVAGRQWRIMPGGDDPADKLVAKMCEEAFKGIRRFSEARYELAQAVIRGLSFAYIEGERKLATLANTAPLEWWLPTGLKDIDRRRFRLVPQWEGRGDSRKLHVPWEMFSITNRQWEQLNTPELFIKITYNDEEARLGYGRGLLEAIYFYHWIKGEILKEGLHGIKKWARGKSVAKIDGLRRGSAGPTDDRSNDALRERWLTALQRMEEENILVMDKNDEVETVETTGTGHQLVMEMIRYLDGAIMSLILGSSLPFGGGEDVGSNARASTELDVHESLIQFDREKLDEDITQDLVGLWVRMNRANFVQLGLGAARKPRFETMQEKREEPEKNAGVVATLTGAGIDLKKDEVYQKVGFTPPQEGDEVIKGRQASALPFGSPFDGAEFDKSMPSPESAALARTLIKLGTKPDEAVRCAVETTMKLSGRAEPVAPAPAPTPPPQPITVNNHIAAAAPAPAPQSAAPTNVTSQIHLPERILLEAMRPPDPAPIHVNVQPTPVHVNVQPTPVSVQAPNVNVAAPNVTVAAPNVDVHVTPKILAEVKLLDALPFELKLPPVKKQIEFVKDRSGAIVGAEIKAA